MAKQLRATKLIPRLLVFVFSLCSAASFTAAQEVESSSVVTEDDTEYLGSLKNGLPHGQCTATWADGMTYAGEWVDGIITGQGTCTYPSGHQYIGGWKNAKRSGHGVFKAINPYYIAAGPKYIGEWKDGKFDAGIKYADALTVVPQQLYRDGVPQDGAETISNTDGSIKYFGTVQPGGDGFGVYFYPNGDTYTGTVIHSQDDALPQGEGTYQAVNGDRYVGEWNNGQKSGLGKYTTTSGFEYMGYWEDDAHHGGCAVTYTDGDWYAGNMREGKRHGQGTYRWENGDTYGGEWADGLKSGQGVYTWTDGRVFSGIYREGQRNGEGVLTKLDGKRYSGMYKDGMLVEGTETLVVEYVVDEEPEEPEIPVHVKRDCPDCGSVRIATKGWVRVNKYETCDWCNGSGYAIMRDPCSHCNSDGKNLVQVWEECQTCDGAGEID
jgi:hypothetical protein